MSNNVQVTPVKEEEDMDGDIIQENMNSAAWEACNIFRGVMDAAGYKDYILTILFIKYISDIWKEKKEEYERQHGDNQDRTKRKMEREPFILPEGTDFYALHSARTDSNIGEKINRALDTIENANTKKLKGVFRNIDFNSEANLGQTKDRNRRLSTLLDNFNKPELDMRPSRVSEDIIGNTYIYLIERFASNAGKKAGEFYTPHKVSQLVARLCAPTEGARICDPACGSGGLLIEAAKVVGTHNYALFGMEANGSTWALARMNMFLHRAHSARIEWCNTLTDPKLVEGNRVMQFDAIVANPPFSLDKWGADKAASDPYARFARGVPPKSKGDYAFISHMIAAAAEKKGRIAVVVPHGVLFRGASEGNIRRALVQENVLDAVIGLPGNLFPTTSIPVAILVFDRAREPGGALHNRTDVLFIDASKQYQAGKNQNYLDDQQLERIVQCYQARQTVQKYAYAATAAEIADNDYNLNIPRYVDTFEEEEDVDIVAVQQEIKTLEGELSQVRTEMAQLLTEVAT